MMNRLFFKLIHPLKWLLLLSSLSIGATTEQLYLIAGSQDINLSNQYPTILYGIGKDLKLKHIRTITSYRQGSLFVRPYYDDNMVIIGSHSQPDIIQLDIIDTRQIDKKHSIEIKVAKERRYAKTYHVNLDGQLYHMVINYHSKEPKPRIELLGFNYTDGKKTKLDTAALSSIQMNGGSSGNFKSDYLNYTHFLNQKPVYTGSLNIPFNWSLPSNYSFEDRDFFSFDINNRYLRVITPFKTARIDENGKQMTLHLVYNKLTNKWSSIKLENSGWLRAFGPWISMSQSKKGFTQSKELRKEEEKDKYQKMPYQSAVRRFALWHINKPGIIELVHPASGRHIRLDTGHFDSETLLIADEKVIYRVNNQIYQAQIDKDKLVNRQLLVQDDMVPGIHWGFLGQR